MESQPGCDSGSHLAIDRFLQWHLLFPAPDRFGDEYGHRELHYELCHAVQKLWGLAQWRAHSPALRSRDEWLWEPWSTGAGGREDRAKYDRGLRSGLAAPAHDRFVAIGATNVRWVFCVSTEVPNNYSSTIASNFPGASYVDWLAFDAYNFGTGFPDHTEGWVPLTYGVGTSYTSLDALGTNKPMMINEIGCGEAGGSKGAWITTSLMQTIPTLYPKVQVVSWFHRDSRPAEPDWRINSSTGAQAAFSAAANSPLYGGSISADGRHIAEVLYETESATVYGKSSDTHRILTDTNFSGGEGTILDANAVNDYVTYTLPALPAGTYGVYVGIKKINTRGQFQLAVSRADTISFSNLGSVVDEYDPNINGVFTEVSLGTWSPTSTNDKLFRFTVTGKNAAVPATPSVSTTSGWFPSRDSRLLH